MKQTIRNQRSEVRGQKPAVRGQWAGVLLLLLLSSALCPLPSAFAQDQTIQRSGGSSAGLSTDIAANTALTMTVSNLMVAASNAAFFATVDFTGFPRLSFESDRTASVSNWLQIRGPVSLSQSVDTNRPTITTNLFGATPGFTFNGTNQTLTNLSALVTGTNSGSLSIIFKTGATVTNTAVLVAQANSAAANDWWEFGIASDGKLYVESNASGTKHTVKGSTTLLASTVYHTVLTYDGTDYYLLLNNTEENPLFLENAGTPSWLGRVSGSPVFSAAATVTSAGAARFFNGSIGSIYFWNFDLTL